MKRIPPAGSPKTAGAPAIGVLLAQWPRHPHRDFPDHAGCGRRWHCQERQGSPPEPTFFGHATIAAKPVAPHRLRPHASAHTQVRPTVIASPGGARLRPSRLLSSPASLESTFSSQFLSKSNTSIRARKSLPSKLLEWDLPSPSPRWAPFHPIPRCRLNAGNDLTLDRKNDNADRS
jgi:hypothetical protein